VYVQPVKEATEGEFGALCRRLQSDSDVLGYFLTGSRGKGFAAEGSDYDVVIVVEDSARDAARNRYPLRYHRKIDCIVHSIGEFRKYGSLGSSQAWDRYSFAHLNVEFDTTGEIQRLVDEKGALPPSQRSAFLADRLDTYINAVYRSIKGSARQDPLAARLEGAGSIDPLLSVIFGLEGRHAPFLGYLECELRSYPLGSFPLSPEQLLEALVSILSTDGVAAQQKLLRVLDRLCRREGLGHVFDGWGEDYSWMLSYGHV
jgi:hypothetical protein